MISPNDAANLRYLPSKPCGRVAALGVEYWKTCTFSGFPAWLQIGFHPVYTCMFLSKYIPFFDSDPEAASAPPLSCASIAPSLLIYFHTMSLTAPHSTQTGEFSRQHDNQQQPQGKGAAAGGPGHRWLSYNKLFYLSHRQTSFSFAPACQ